MKGPSTAFGSHQPFRHAGGMPAAADPLESEGRKFGEAAERLAGASALLLGWRPDEFWNATPAELATAQRLFEADGPNPDAIAQLRARFPDEE